MGILENMSPGSPLPLHPGHMSSLSPLFPFGKVRPSCDSFLSTLLPEGLTSGGKFAAVARRAQRLRSSFPTFCTPKPPALPAGLAGSFPIRFRPEGAPRPPSPLPLHPPPSRFLLSMQRLKCPNPGLPWRWCSGGPPAALLLSSEKIQWPQRSRGGGWGQAARTRRRRKPAGQGPAGGGQGRAGRAGIHAR